MPPIGFRREFIKSLIYQLLRGLLWAWLGRLVAKGYFTSGQADYLLIGFGSFLIAVGSVAVSSVLRYARSAAMRHLPPNATPQQVRELGWEILRNLLNTSDDIPKEPNA